MEHIRLLPQDLHCHTVLSSKDKDVHPLQTPEFIREHRHAEIIGISDHFDMIVDFEEYSHRLRACGFFVGCEVDGADWVDQARNLPFDYYFYHLRPRDEDYEGRKALVATGRPVIVSHPMELGTDLSRLPDGAITEINNRYIWRNNWREFFTPHLGRLKFVISSDAHQPNWLGQRMARQVQCALGIDEFYPLG